MFATTRKQDSIIRGLSAENKTTGKILGTVPDEKIHVENADDDNKIWVKVEIDPEFPGGEIEWIKFVKQNLDVNVPSKNNAPEGKYTVWIQLIVGKDGHASNWKSLTNQGYGMEEEALRIISKVPLWVPGQQNGYNVRSYKKIPITFIVQ